MALPYRRATPRWSIYSENCVCYRSRQRLALAGDYVLTTLASRMTQALREGDTLARVGGDEFVAVLIDLADAATCEPMLLRLLEAAAQPVQFGEFTLQVSASMGVTFYPQAQELGAEQLLRQADQAMYQAKAAGKNRYQVFEAG